MKRFAFVAVSILLVMGLVSQILLGQLLSTSAPLLLQDDTPTVNYFAYGTNMNDRYFSQLRGIPRYTSQAAVLAEYRVSFSILGLPVAEPSFANLSPVPGSIAYGVIHRIREKDFARIVGSEGANYEVVDIVVTLQDGSIETARTLVSPITLSTPVLPSRRYLSYLHEAAIQYGFPAEVIDAYDPHNGRYIPIVSELIGSAIHSVVWITARL